MGGLPRHTGHTAALAPRLVARSWAYPRSRQPAPNGLEHHVGELIMGLATENPRWGYLRIVGQCAKLGVSVSASSVGNALSRHRLRPAPRAGPSWPEFLRAHAAGTLAWDFFHVESVMLARLYVLFFIDLERRLVYLAELTAHPVGPWVTQQVRGCVPGRPGLHRRVPRP